MANVIDIAKAAVIAYNEKDWSKARDILAANAVYDEKGTNRRIQGAGEIIEAWQGWAKAFPDSKLHSCASSRAGTPRSSNLSGKALTQARYRHQQVPFRLRTSGSRCRPARSSRSRVARPRALALLRSTDNAHTDRSHRRGKDCRVKGKSVPSELEKPAGVNRRAHAKDDDRSGLPQTLGARPLRL